MPEFSPTSCISRASWLSQSWQFRVKDSAELSESPVRPPLQIEIFHADLLSDDSSPVVSPSIVCWPQPVNISASMLCYGVSAATPQRTKPKSYDRDACFQRGHPGILSAISHGGKHESWWKYAGVERLDKSWSLPYRTRNRLENIVKKIPSELRRNLLLKRRKLKRS